MITKAKHSRVGGHSKNELCFLIYKMEIKFYDFIKIKDFETTIA